MYKCLWVHTIKASTHAHTQNNCKGIWKATYWKQEQVSICSLLKLTKNKEQAEEEKQKEKADRP